MSTTQSVYGNNGFNKVGIPSGTSVPQLTVQTVKTSDLKVLNKVSFFGASPAVGQAAVVTPITSSASGAEIAAAVNALILILQNSGLSA